MQKQIDESQEINLLRRIFKTPSGQKMKLELEMEESQQRARRDAIDGLPRLRDERVAMIDRHMSEHDESVEAIREAQRAYYEAVRQGSALESRHHGEMFMMDTKIANCELFLRESAPKYLYEQIAKLEAEINLIRAEPITDTLMRANRTDAFVQTNHGDLSKRIKTNLLEIQKLKSRMLTEV